MKEEDKKQICEGFQEIERDLAFEVLESWRERKLDEFIVALENLQLLIEVSQKVCG